MRIQEAQFIDFERNEIGIKEVIGCNIAQVRKRQKMTQRQAADLMGTSLAQWKKYELGQDVMRTDTASIWCCNTGTPMQRLLLDTAYSTHPHDEPLTRCLDRLSFCLSRMKGQHFEHVLYTLSHVFCLKFTAPRFADTAPGCIQFVGDSKALSREYFRAIGTGMQKYRKRTGLSQQEVAEGFNISLSAYQKYEQSCTPTRFSLILAARFPHVTKENPMDLVKATKIGAPRFAQDQRLSRFRDLLHQIGQEHMDFVEQLVFKMVHTLPSLEA